MSWWGKVVGGVFGFVLGGPLGAIAGAALGHSFDKGLGDLPDDDEFSEGDRERVQLAFFTATFSVMGALAKADGQVSKDEIRLAEAVMDEFDLAPEQRKAAINLFNEGKKADFPLEEALEQFRHECHGRTTLLRMFMELQVQAAFADGEFDSAEEALLLKMCEILHFSVHEFRRLEEMIRAEVHFHQTGSAQAKGPTLADAYAMLNVDENASDDEVKKSYRRLLSQHHPDKLVAKGLPEEMMKKAAQQTHEIRQAYEMISKARGL